MRTFKLRYVVALVACMLGHRGATSFSTSSATKHYFSLRLRSQQHYGRRSIPPLYCMYASTSLSLLASSFYDDFEDFGELVTWCWMTSLWEKCSKFNVKVVVTDTALEMPRERDKWMMQEFIRVGYKGSDLRRLNRVRLYQQVLYLSYIVNASGGELDERYLRQ